MLENRIKKHNLVSQRVLLGPPFFTGEQFKRDNTTTGIGFAFRKWPLVMDHRNSAHAFYQIKLSFLVFVKIAFIIS